MNTVLVLSIIEMGTELWVSDIFGVSSSTSKLKQFVFNGFSMINKHTWFPNWVAISYMLIDFYQRYGFSFAIIVIV